MSDILDGVLDVVDTEEPALHTKTAPEKQTEKVETKTTETKTPEAAKEEPKEETKTEKVAPAEDDEEVEDTQDFSRTPTDDTETPPETTEPSKTETEKPKEADTTPDWEPNLPPPPEFKLPAPEINEEGYITNMTPEQYQTYIVEKAKYEMRLEAHTQRVEDQALDAAEKILPELKTNPAVRQMVENARVASILNGKQINSYEAAKTVAEALGITSTKLAEAKAEGAQNAKVSITTQKNAAVETTGSTKKKTDPTAKNIQLSKRLKAGDDEAFAELFDTWDKEGKLS